MAQLSLSLLGSFQAALDGKPITRFKSNRVRALLAYLAVEAERPHGREALAGLLWPDWPDREALSNLRYSLSDLRRAIGDREADPPFLLISRNNLQFNPDSNYSLDVQTFLQAADADDMDGLDLDLLDQTAALYQGSFLEGFSLEDSAAFEEWRLLTRERLVRQASSLLHALAESFETGGDYEKAQSYAYQQLELEPWDETAHQRLMRTLVLSGRRSAALAQYETCRELLADDLGIEPSEETKKLYDQIREGTLKVLTPSALAQAEPDPKLASFLEEDVPGVEIPVFVGRERELARLNEFLNCALRGQGQVVFVTGEAGSGKTSLVQEFTRQAQEAHADLLVAAGNCNAYTGIGDPYLPFREVLELLTGNVEAKWAAGAIASEHARRLWNMLPATVQALIECAPYLIDTFVQRGSLIERTKARAPERPDWLTQFDVLLQRKPNSGIGTSGHQQSALFEQYTKVLQAVAGQKPLLLAVDDLQWADQGSVSLLFHIGRHLEGSRILIVGAYRSEEVAMDKDGERHLLEPLVNEFQRTFGNITVNVDQGEGRDFIDAFLDTEPNQLGNSFRESLYQQTRGHPLFTIELLRGLQERGDLIEDGEKGWIEGPFLNWEALPARVEAAIRERIDRLPESLHRILDVASVEGEDFTAEVVAQILGEGEREIVKRLSSELVRKHRLVRAQAIEHVGSKRASRYRFRNYLFQKYVYDHLDEAERAYLHEDVGKGLETLYEGRANEIAVQLARHFHEARIIEKAIQYLHQAGQKAVQLSAYQEGIAHLNRGLTLLEGLPDSNARTQQELDLQLALCIALVGHIGYVPEVELVHKRARELCQRTGDTAQLCRVVSEMAVYHYVGAEYQQARELAEEAFNLAQEVEDPLLVAMGHWMLGFISFCLGEYVYAQSHLGQVIEFYRPEEHHHSFIALRGSDVGVSALAYHACCLWCLGYPDQAGKESQEALAIARELKHPFTLADTICYGGCLFNMMRRDNQAMKENAQELLQLGDQLKGWQSSATLNYGEAIALSGRFEEGIAQIRQGLELREFGEKCCWSGALYSLAEAQVHLNHAQEGLSTLAEALTLVEESDERYYEAEIYRLKGKLLLLQGDEAGAEASLHKAIEVAGRQQAKMWELRAVIDLSRLWLKQGKAAEAQKKLSKVYHWFTEGFDTPDLVEADQMLKELSQ
jgi:DNA-binding SARP family transcriptional activator/predicted negative regulator of RcsB-dependent stress response